MKRLRRLPNLKRNPALTAGLAGLLVLAVLTAFGPALAPRDATEPQALARVGIRSVLPPFEPSPEFPLGSDRMGRDILSGVLAGARWTLSFVGLVTTASFAVAVPLGLWAGWRGGAAAALVRSLAALAGAVPTLILGILLLQSVLGSQAVVPRPVAGVQYNMWPVVIKGALLLGLVGVPRVADLCRRLTQSVMVEPYMEAARAVGAGTGRLLFRHVLPNLSAHLAVAAVVELAFVLRLLAMLGIFEVFLVPAFAYEVPTPGGGEHIIMVPAVPEWTSYFQLPLQHFQRTWWILLYPGAAVAFAMLTFQLLSEGLRRHWKLV